VAHISSRGGLAEQLLEQGVFPSLARRVIAVVIGPVEAAVGALGLAATAVAGGGRAAPLAGIAAVALYTGFVLFALYLWQRVPEAPCGCGPAGERASGWTVGRAAVLAGCALAGLAGVPGGTASPDVLAYSAVIAAALGLLIWQLPGAMELRRMIREL
jgi:hypothetical protein